MSLKARRCTALMLTWPDVGPTSGAAFAWQCARDSLTGLCRQTRSAEGVFS